MPATDFTTITYLGYVPNILSNKPLRYLQIRSPELIVVGKSKTWELTFGSTGNGSTQHLAAVLFAKIANIDIRHVPYKGSGQAIIDLMAGQITMNFDTMPPLLEQIKAGKLRALAIFDTEAISLITQSTDFFGGWYSRF
jgi:tripartite-type tricarboxylate transporter receptor subunit TctC